MKISWDGIKKGFREVAMISLLLGIVWVVALIQPKAWTAGYTKDVFGGKDQSCMIYDNDDGYIGIRIYHVTGDRPEFIIEVIDSLQNGVGFASAVVRTDTQKWVHIENFEYLYRDTRKSMDRYCITGLGYYTFANLLRENKSIKLAIRGHFVNIAPPTVDGDMIFNIECDGFK